MTLVAERVASSAATANAWPQCSIGEIAEVIDGDRGSNYPTGGNFSPNGYCLFLNAGNVTKEGFKFNECQFITELKDSALSNGRLERNDIVLTTRGTVGNVAFYNGAVPYKHLRINSGMVILRTRNDSKLLPEYLYSVCRSSIFQQQVERLAFGSAQPQLTVRGVSSFICPLPPTTEEQRAIAAALSDVDALISGLDQLIAKKRDIKQAAMQQLLTGKTRLPGFEGGWVSGPIGSDVELLTGFPFPSSRYTDSGVRLLRGSNVKRGVTDWAGDITQFWPSIGADVARYELSIGDLVIAMDGSLVGRSFARLSESDLPALLLQRVARLRSSTIDIGYLTQWVGSVFFVEYMDSVKTVTAIPHISPADIRNLPVSRPKELAEQRAIAEALADMDTEIAAVEARRNKTKLIEQGIMQELLTGRTRLV